MPFTSSIRQRAQGIGGRRNMLDFPTQFPGTRDRSTRAELPVNPADLKDYGMQSQLMVHPCRSR